MFISGVNDTGDKLFGGVNDTAELAINLCCRFSLIGGVIDTGDKFITGVVDTAKK
jgi:hypothetical protein